MLIMTEKIVHISDSLVSIEQYETNNESPLGGLEDAVNTAQAHDVDAVVHTGDLFRRPDPAEEVLDAVATKLSELTISSIPFFVIEGQRTKQGDSLDHLIEAEVATRLSNEATVVGDIALYGVDYAADEDEILDQIAEFEPTADYTHNVICVHGQIWPPVFEAKADVSAYDVMDATDVHIGGVLAGGTTDSQEWDSDEYDYGVRYPGSTNPQQLIDGQTPQGYLVSAGNTGLRYEEFNLATAEPNEELVDLQQALRFTPSEIDDLDLEMLADLYSHAAQAKKVFEDRRQELRDELLARIEDNREISGRHALVERSEQRRRNMKSCDSVAASLESANIDVNEVTTIDSSKLRDLVDEDRIEEDAVFDIERKPYVRVKDI